MNKPYGVFLNRQLGAHAETVELAAMLADALSMAGAARGAVEIFELCQEHNDFAKDFCPLCSPPAGHPTTLAGPPEPGEECGCSNPNCQV